MFTHPALLRQLTLAADQLRRAGEGAWARRIVQTTDGIRKLGWTEAALGKFGELFEGEPRFESVNFGAEHERRLGGPQGVGEANARLSEMRAKIKELALHPTQAAPDPKVQRQRSPDLA